LGGTVENSRPKAERGEKFLGREREGTASPLPTSYGSGGAL